MGAVGEALIIFYKLKFIIQSINIINKSKKIMY